MKKIIAIMFALLLVANMAIVGFAANGAFVSSPSKNLAPILIEATIDEPDCTADVKITSYADRATLGDESAAELLAAYNSIASAEDLGTTSSEIAAFAKELGVASNTFAVSDLFDISYTDCDGHELHGEFDITIKPTSTENFACMLHYVDSEWEVIEGKVENGEISFTTELFSPFAIVVCDALPEAPAGVAPWIIALGVALLVCVIVVIILVVIKRKKKDEKTAKN